MNQNRHMIEFTVTIWRESRLLTEMFKLNDLLVFDAKYDHSRQGFVYRCFAPWLEEQPEGSLPVPFELRPDHQTGADGYTRLVNIVLVRSPAPEPCLPPPCPNCERLKQALAAKNWISVLDCLSTVSHA